MGAFGIRPLARASVVVALSTVSAAGFLGCASGNDDTNAGDGTSIAGAGAGTIAGASAAGAGVAGVGVAGATAGTGTAIAGAAGTMVGGAAGVMPIAGTIGDVPVAGTAPIAGTGPIAGTMAIAGEGGTGSTTPPGENCLQGSGDFTANGPYAFGMMDVSIGSSGMYTIFFPEPLDPNCKHPIVAWGNGTGVTGSSTYAFYNQHAASWGMVVIASHNSNVGSGEFHRAGLDYLLAENDNPSSKFHQKLSTRAGTSGHSQGGIGANAGAAHMNVEAIVNVQGAFGRAPGGPAFLCLTGTEDINPAGCKSSVDGSSDPAMHANYEGADHVGTATVGGFIGRDPGTIQYMRLYTAWFRCFLADDEGACAMFRGGMSCPVCSDPGWAEIYSNNF